MKAICRSFRSPVAGAEFLLILPAAAVLSCCTGALAETLHYRVVTRGVVEARLGRYGGKDQQREETLREMFTEAGCGATQLTEQTVKGSKLPNVICTLPGSTGQTIL
jgi:hypothetical protein